MPAIRQVHRFSAIALCIACCVRVALADDPRAGNTLPRIANHPPAEQAIYNDRQQRRDWPPSSDDAAAPMGRSFPDLFQRAERQASAEQAVDGGHSPQRVAPRQNGLVLAPFAGEAKPGARTGEVPSFLTGAASLGIVLGLFLLVVWVVRRGMPKNAALLPSEALEILGRAPLIGKQQVHLVRCGNKVLLLHASPTGVETLTEITDPDEVDRLAGICLQSGSAGVTASFRQAFGQFGGQSRGLDYLAPGSDEDPDFGDLESVGHQGRGESHF
jgi:flagellar biogenesis protein FliO